MSALFGFINAFKPPGPSSAAFGNWVKHETGGAAVGHWGTLDPTACGVLLLAVGKATKLLPLLPASRKQYVFELVVGERTDTGDAKGIVVAASDVPGDWARGLADVAASLAGPQMQIPPMHSAVKVDGQPLYRAARKGLEVRRPPRTVTVHELGVIATSERTARLYVDCDAGTYVRVLCEELGRRLGLPARVGALLRVGSGPFLLRNSVRPDQIMADPQGCVIDPLGVLRNERIGLDATAARRFLHGSEVRVDGLGDSRRSATAQISAATEVLVTCNGVLIGCGNVLVSSDAAMLAPTRVLAEPDERKAQGSTAEEANE